MVAAFASYGTIAFLRSLGARQRFYAITGHSLMAPLLLRASSSLYCLNRPLLEHIPPPPCPQGPKRPPLPLRRNNNNNNKNKNNNNNNYYYLGWPPHVDTSVVVVMVVVRGRVGGISAPPPPRGLIAGNTRACSLPHTHWPSGSGVLFVKCPCRIVLSCLHSALARQVHPQSVSQDCQASMVVSLNSH